GLLEDVLKGLADPASAQLGYVFSSYSKFKDEISYDKNDINGGTWDITTNSPSEMHVDVDRTQPETGKNRSGMYRFLKLTSETTNVTSCNREGAKVHAKVSGLSLDVCSGGLCALGASPFAECEIYKIENLAKFYLDSIANAQQYDPSEKP